MTLPASVSNQSNTHDSTDQPLPQTPLLPLCYRSSTTLLTIHHSTSQAPHAILGRRNKDPLCTTISGANAGDKSPNASATHRERCPARRRLYGKIYAMKSRIGTASREETAAACCRVGGESWRESGLFPTIRYGGAGDRYCSLRGVVPKRASPEGEE